LTVRALASEEYLCLLRTSSTVSFLQTQAWAQVKPEWRAEYVGWERAGHLVGAGLVLHRPLPVLGRTLAYLPEGPVIDWDAELAEWLVVLADHLRRGGAFGVRMGPPVVVRRWTAAQVKEGIADPAVRRLTDLPPAERTRTGAAVVSQLRELGWRPPGATGGFGAGQPQFNFWLPLAGRTEDEVLAGMNQLWRRNIRKAAKAGVVVTRGTDDDLDAFHDLYVHTAARDHFTPRPAAYFRRMYDALTAEDPDRISLHLAHHEGDLVAATIGIRVGTHAWYSYGASSSDKREVRGSNAVQWQMIRDAMAAGAEVYDLRGITETLDADDSHVGLIQFKVGTGGDAVEYAGEWDLPLNPLLYKGFELYLRRRS
jgi:vancomycin resistance protein VanK